MDIVVAGSEHFKFADIISQTIESSAKDRGTGIALRKPAYIIEKMHNGNAVIAIDDNNFAGFCYIEVWQHGQYVAHSGLIVHPQYRGKGIAKAVKQAVFELSKTKYPAAKVFGITTSQAVMKINSELGYKPVHFLELTSDEDFWQGCRTCNNYDILTRTDGKMCLCTAMLYKKN